MEAYLEKGVKPEAEKVAETLANFSEKDLRDVTLFMQGVRFAEMRKKKEVITHAAD